MERNVIFNKAVDVLIDQLGINPDEVRPDATFTDDLGMDSLDVVECIMAMEEEFDIEVDDEVMIEWRTVSDAVDFLENTLD